MSFSRIENKGGKKEKKKTHTHTHTHTHKGGKRCSRRRSTSGSVCHDEGLPPKNPSANRRTEEEVEEEEEGSAHFHFSALAELLKKDEICCCCCCCCCRLCSSLLCSSLLFSSSLSFPLVFFSHQASQQKHIRPRKQTRWLSPARCPGPHQGLSIKTPLGPGFFFLFLLRLCFS